MTVAAKLFSSALEILSDKILIVDLNLQPVFLNKSFSELVGLESSSKILLSKILPEIAPADLTQNTFSTKLIRLNGDSLAVTVTCQRIDGHYLLTFFKAELSKQALQTQRLEMLGRLAGGVAHDFNNVLAGILGHTAYLRNILPRQGEHIISLDAIEEGGQKASQITSEILKFSKQENSDDLSPLCLGTCIKKTVNLLRGALSPKLIIEYSEPDGKIHILGSEVKLSQVLINLCINARDALAEAKRTNQPIKITLQKAQTEVLKTTNFSNSKSGYALIEITDTGCGISPDILGRIFEPYFSTKAENGTGLGMTIVSEIIKTLKGEIKIISQLGQGTTVRIFLPIVASQPNQIKANHGQEVVSGTARVLIVDDESSISKVVSLNLKQYGYQVECCSSGKEAYQRYQTGERFDLILLDLLMPGMSGEELFHLIRKIEPEQKILLMSGFCSQDIIDDLLDSGASGFMSKPFNIDQLAQTIKSVVRS